MPKQPSTLKSRGSIPRSKILFYIFSVLLFAFVVYYFSEIKKDVVLLRKVNVAFLSAAIILQLLTYLINAKIYQTLLKGYQVYPLPGLFELYKVSVISLVFNQTFPSAGVSGNTFIFNLLLRRGIDVPKILSIILLELLIFYLAMNIFIGLFLVNIFLFYPLPHVFVGLLGFGLIIYLVFGALILLLSKKRYYHTVIRKLGKVKFIKRFFDKRAAQVQHEIKPYETIALLAFSSSHKLMMVKSIFWQLLLMVIDASTILLLFYGLGTPVSLYIVILVLVCTRIISILPFSPGALILYESSMVFLFNSLAAPLGASIMATLIFRLLSFWLPIPAGFFLYRRWAYANQEKAV